MHKLYAVKTATGRLLNGNPNKFTGSESGQKISTDIEAEVHEEVVSELPAMK